MAMRLDQPAVALATLVNAFDVDELGLVRERGFAVQRELWNRRGGGAARRI
jgi:hypothetical protein